MKRERSTIILLAMGLSFLPAARAVMADANPYRAIVDRNAFGIIPPPPPAPPDTNPPPSNLKLTGITTLFGSRKAMLLVQETGPGAKPERSLILNEGERDGQIEIVQIDDAAGIVKVNNGGRAETLSFEKNGVTLPSAPAPGVPGVPGVPQPMPGGAPGIPNIPRPGVSTIGGAPNTPGVPAVPAPGTGTRVPMPSRALRAPQTSTAPAQNTMTPETQAILMAKDHVEHQDQIQAGTYPPSPPPIVDLLNSQ